MRDSHLAHRWCENLFSHPPCRNPFLRPAELAGHNSIAMDVVRHALSWLGDNEGAAPEIVAYLQPTSPLREARHIDKALALLSEDVDSVWTLAEAEQHPYYMFEDAGGGRMREYVEMENKPERRQDFPPLYFVNPLIMMAWTRYILAPGNERALVVNPKNFKPLIVDPLEGVDINTERDFRVAEQILLELADIDAGRADGQTVRRLKALRAAG